MRVSLIILSFSLYACGADDSTSTVSSAETVLSSGETTQEVKAEFWDDESKLVFLNHCQNRIQDWEYTHQCQCAVELVTKQSKRDLLFNYGRDFIFSDENDQCVTEKLALEGDK